MAYVEVKDFKDGLDTRRPAIVGESGTFIEAKNGHITRGGDFESVKAFEPYFTLLPGTFGLHSNRNRLYVFGSETAPINLPGDILYQRLQHPSGAAMSTLLSAKNQDGLIYAIAEYADGSIYHFYDGTRVTEWDTKAGTIADDQSVAAYLADKIDVNDAFIASANGADILITAAVPGMAFSISAATTGTGSAAVTQLQINQPAVAEVRAVAQFTVTGGFTDPANQITVIQAGTTDLIDDPINFVLDAAATALQCSIAINRGTGTHGYLASVAGAVVTIQAPVGQGATANGRSLTVTPTGFLTVGSVSNFTGGVTAIAARPQIEKVTIGGTFAAANTYSVTLDGQPYTITGLSSGYSRIAEPFRDKMYTAVRGLAIASAVGDPTDTDGVGSATINISSQDQGSEDITAFGVYQNRLAIFSALTVQIWDMDPDPKNNIFRQLLQNTGTRSPNAIVGYGNSDLMYLSDTGIRSLRARDSSNAAFVDDIGTRIDDHVLAFLDTLTDEDIRQARAITDPRDGRGWIAIKDRVYIFSYFPGSRVSAWTYYDLDFDVDALAVAGRRIYVRSGDTIYRYGGLDNQTYPADGEVEVRLQLPFFDANRITGGKMIKGVDVICSGQWTISLLLDPRDTTKATTPLTVDGPTTLLYEIPTYGLSAHFAPLLTSTKGGRLTLSSVIVHFDDTENR